MAQFDNDGQHYDIPTNPQELQGQRTVVKKGADVGFEIGQESGAERNMRVPGTPMPRADIECGDCSEE